jgi:hypothetical protein
MKELLIKITSIYCLKNKKKFIHLQTLKNGDFKQKNLIKK